MKLNEDEFIAEIYLRAGVLTKKRKRDFGFALAIICGIILSSLAVLTIPKAGSFVPMGAMSASISTENAILGGFILIGVLCFSLGIIAALVYKKVRNGS